MKVRDVRYRLNQNLLAFFTLCAFTLILNFSSANAAGSGPSCNDQVTELSRGGNVTKPQKIFEQFFNNAGIQLNGNNPEDIKINDPAFFTRVLKDPTLEIGESYMDGQWDSQALDQTVAKLYTAQQKNGLAKTYAPFLAMPVLAAKAIAINMYRYARDFTFNRQTRVRSKQVAEEHYDLGNDLYSEMLDPTMAYTSGEFGPGFTLEDAQIAKYEGTAQRLGLKPGQTILDIGCGFGGFARYASKYYGVKVVGITISEKQLKLARARSAGYPNVEFIYSDYRDIEHRFAPGTFDHAVSIEMVEAVGIKNLEGYFKAVQLAVKDGGRFVMQAISNRRDMVNNNPWVDKYIFPNGVAPSTRQYDKGSESSFGPPVYSHSLTASYDKTLMEWHKNFTAAWPQLQAKYGARFKRMWDFYLLSGAGIFRSGQQNVDQFVYVKGDHRNEVKPYHNIPTLAFTKSRRLTESEKQDAAKKMAALEINEKRVAADTAPRNTAPGAPLEKSAKVLVVGAGPGGLGAARRLQELGYGNVTVLEANETVGGKTHTVMIDGRPHDLGATVGFNGKYDDVNALAVQYGQKIEPLPDSHFYSLKTGQPEPKKTLSQSLRLKIQGLKYFMNHLKLSGFSERGLEVPPTELADSWYVQMSRLGANEFAQEMKKYLEGFGYGHDGTPAAFAYRLFDLKAVMGSAVKSKPMMYANGTQEIWQGVASDLNNVRTNSKVSKIVRHDGNGGVDVYIGDSTSPEHYDKLIMATDPKTSIGIIDATPEETDLFSQVKYMPYATFAVRVEGFSEGKAQVGYLRENMARRFGRPMAWIKRYADQNVFIFHLFAPPEMSDRQIVNNIADDMKKLGGQKFTLVESKRWPFFPHVDGVSMRENHFYERVHNLQGENNTVFINEALSMSTMPDAYKQGQQAAERLATGEYIH